MLKQPEAVLSDKVISAEQGEFYAYTSVFTRECPLYALLKCKANKDRPITAAEDLGPEANLLFQIGDPDRIQVSAVNEADRVAPL